MIAKSNRKIKSKSREGIFFQAMFFILNLFIIGVLINSHIKITEKRSELVKKIESLKEEIKDLEEQKQNLEAGISQTEKESYWEERVRDQGLVKEGENPVVVIPPEEIEEESTTAKSFQTRFWEQVKNFIAKITNW
jgi:cell division protein FtsB